MKPGIHAVFCVMVALTGSSQTRGQSHAVPPAFTSATSPGYTETPTPPPLMDDPRNELLQPTRNPETAEATNITQTDGTVHTDALTHLLTSNPAAATSQHTQEASGTTLSLSTAANRPSNVSTGTTPPQQSSTTEGSEPLATVSSQTLHTVQHWVSTAARQQSGPPSRTPQTSASAQPPTAPTHQEPPSELNVGDEDLKGPHRRSSSPLDPLLAGLLSVFIVTTAVVFIALFLKFRQRTNHPEFHRLQDLPMDDLMEDTPLSRFSY